MRLHPALEDDLRLETDAVGLLVMEHGVAVTARQSPVRKHCGGEFAMIQRELFPLRPQQLVKIARANGAQDAVVFFMK